MYHDGNVEFFLIIKRREKVMAEKQQGTVKWFSKDKGFGFIASHNKDYFVHFRDIQHDGYKNLSEGQKVLFKAVKDAKGISAKEVEQLA